MIYDNREWDWVDELTENRAVAWAIVVLLVLCVISATSALAGAPLALVAKDMAGNVWTIYDKPCDVGGGAREDPTRGAPEVPRRGPALPGQAL